MAKVTSLVAKAIMDVRKLAALIKTLSKHFPDERISLFYKIWFRLVSKKHAKAGWDYLVI